MNDLVQLAVDFCATSDLLLPFLRGRLSDPASVVVCCVRSRLLMRLCGSRRFDRIASNHSPVCHSSRVFSFISATPHLSFTEDHTTSSGLYSRLPLSQDILRLRIGIESGTWTRSLWQLEQTFRHAIEAKPGSTIDVFLNAERRCMCLWLVHSSTFLSNRSRSLVAAARPH